MSLVWETKMPRKHAAAATAVHRLTTCWAEPETAISQHHEQKSGAEELREAQREVSELRVRVIPPVTGNAAEPPQLVGVQPGPDKDAGIRPAPFRPAQRFLGQKLTCS